MPTDAERFRFLAEHKLSVTWTNDGASIFWRGKDEPGKPGVYFPVASARTLEEAVDAAIARWERKQAKLRKPR
jgi:hypothetical protein